MNILISLVVPIITFVFGGYLAILICTRQPNPRKWSQDDRRFYRSACLLGVCSGLLAMAVRGIE